MKATELRLGNLIYTKVKHIDLGVLLENPESNEYEPIPLTDEWLLRFGFEKSGDAYFSDTKYKDDC